MTKIPSLIALSVLSFIVTTLASAPAPRPKPQPPPPPPRALPEGAAWLVWEADRPAVASTWDVRLEWGGLYRASCGSFRYAGSWTYRPETRTLLIDEHDLQRNIWRQWQITFDLTPPNAERWSGRTAGAWGTVTAVIVRKDARKL